MAELVKQFHNLEGVSIGERKKSLYALLKNPSLQSQQDEFLINLQPQTFLEELFKLDILIFLRRTSDLLEILKDGNEIFVSKIIKQHWFFKDAFQSISAENFVNECLPSMSYALRMKVLKKLSIVLSEEQVDNLFDALLKRYGLFIAKQFLAFCTTAKIVNILQTHEIELHAGHLHIFFKKDKNLMLVYIDELKKQGKELSDKKFIQRLAEKDVSFFLKLKDKYKIQTSVGRRTSKKIIDLRKDDILANPKDYVDILKESVVSRKLKMDFKEFYLKLFSGDKLAYGNTYECNRFLNHAPPRLQFSIMADSYKTVFNEDMLNNEKAMDDDKTLVRLAVGNPEACAMIANARYEKTNDNKYLKYMPISKSVPILKEKINLTSNIYDRSRLIQILIDACKHHKDLKALESVMTYFCKRHRNDDKGTRSEFIRSVLDKFSYDELNDVHWTCLVDLQKVERMKDEYITERVLLYKYMEYLVKQNKPIKEYLDLYVKESLNIWLDEDKVTNPDLFKTVLLELAKEIPLQVPEEDQENTNRTLINYILKFNKKYHDKAIDLYSFQRFVDLLKAKNLKYYSYEHTNNIRTIICSKSRNHIENEILDCYFSSLKDDADSEILEWFVKHDISIIKKYFDNIIVGLVNQNIDHWYVFKKYSHLDLDKMTIAYLEQQFNSEEKSNAKTKLVKPLLRILSPQKYVSFTEKYLPKTDKINLDDDEATDMYNLRCEIAKSFKYVYHKPTVLETVLNYCKGDYLASSLGSLYSTIFNIPEEQIPATLGFLSNRAVSVRKHAIFVSCNILEKRLVLELLKKSGSEEKNVSIQKHLFSSTIKYFSKNPSEDTWDLVKVFINFIDKSDVESLKNLSEFSISKKYRHMFWQSAWEFLEKNKASIPKPHVYMGSLLSKADNELIVQLPIELLEGIIKEYFLGKSELSKAGPLTKFAVTFLLCDKRIDTFKLVFDIIAGFKNENSDWFKEDQSRNKLKKIFDEFISQRKEDYFTAEVINQFFSNWNKLFTPAEAFKEYVMLNVLKMHKDSNDDLMIFSDKLCGFVNTTVERYSLYIMCKLSEYVRYTVGLLLKAETRIILIENILKLNKSTLNCVLCLTFLTLLNGEKEKIYNFLEQIKENKDPAVQILCNLRIRDQ